MAAKLADGAHPKCLNALLYAVPFGESIALENIQQFLSQTKCEQRI
jgi:hypothetical protein